MSKHLSIFSSAVILVACGSAERNVSGSLDLAALGRTNGEAIAVREDGLTASTPVRDDGAFELALESEHRYALAFRDLRDGRMFANLVIVGQSGRTGTFRLADGEGDAVLGSVRPIGADDRSSCRTMSSATPASEFDPANGIATASSFLVTADFDDALTEDLDDHANDPLHDADDDDVPDVNDEDDDDDGLCDDDDHDGAGDDNEADLPYDVKLSIGDTFVLSDAFAEKGPQPAQILSVEMESGEWRLAELRAGTAFEVTQADCDHRGSRDIGRDRIFVAWKNTGGSTALDHLDLRYCEE
jgi:hypothetical protein